MHGKAPFNSLRCKHYWDSIALIIFFYSSILPTTHKPLSFKNLKLKLSYTSDWLIPKVYCFSEQAVWQCNCEIGECRLDWEWCNAYICLTARWKVESDGGEGCWMRRRGRWQGYESQKCWNVGRSQSWYPVTNLLVSLSACWPALPSAAKLSNCWRKIQDSEAVFYTFMTFRIVFQLFWQSVFGLKRSYIIVLLFRHKGQVQD